MKIEIYSFEECFKYMALYLNKTIVFDFCTLLNFCAISLHSKKIEFNKNQEGEGRGGGAKSCSNKFFSKASTLRYKFRVLDTTNTCDKCNILVKILN